jgi:cob(I)alamin adenosyltransferase
MIDKLVVNCGTGEITEVNFTQEEITQREYEASLPPAIQPPTVKEQLEEKEMKIKTLEAQQQQTNEDLSALMDFVITGGM